MKKFTIKTFAIIAASAYILAGCSKADEKMMDSVIPQTLVGIEAVNVNNSGEFPFMTADPISREAYMIGVILIAEHVSGGNQFITGPIPLGQETYVDAARRFNKRIITNSQFNSLIGPGEVISDFFKEIDSRFLPRGVDEGFALLVRPTPGEHSFRIEYVQGNVVRFHYYTPLINLY
jgi:hypothetical protein